jgi:general secretion pathway protein K
MGAERGWALVSTLWALTMLALMAAATESLTATSWRAEQHAIVDSRAQAALDAAVVRAVLGVSDKRTQARWRVDGAHRRFAFDGIALDVAVQDEAGRIDLNASGTALLVALFTANGLAPDAAAALAGRIVDWRTPPGPTTLNGGSDGDYRAARLSYLPRHDLFQSVDEAKLVLGMTPQLFARVRPALTVYSKRASFDASVAPAASLTALYPNDPGKIDAVLRARDGDPNAVAGLGTPPGAASIAVAGRAFAITATAFAGNRTFHRTAIVQLTGNDRAPYYVLAWR